MQGSFNVWTDHKKGHSKVRLEGWWLDGQADGWIDNRWKGLMNDGWMLNDGQTERRKADRQQTDRITVTLATSCCGSR